MDKPITLNRPSEVIYQIYPSSFNDSSGDGCGDLKGITRKLDYIKKLDVDAIWISPFFLSPEGPAGDGGYAITDYRRIDPRYGTMGDFEELLKEAHDRGLRVYTDYVLCHTANDHEWFEKSRNREEGYNDRYVWHGGVVEGEGENAVRKPPNNWKNCFDHGPAWTWDDRRQQYYLHHFAPSQPALNLNDKSVQDASLAEMKFWLDKGVDGLRIDALPFANHDPQFRDNPWRDGIEWPNDVSRERWDMQRFDHSICQPQTVDLVARIRELLDSYPDKKIALGEVIAGREGGSKSPEIATTYIDPEKGLHTCYTESLVRFWKYPPADELRHMLRENLQYAPDGGFCTNASNHDFPRAASRMTQNAPEELRSSIVRQLMSMYMSLPGSICIYQGEELGLPQARIPEDIPHDRKKDLVAAQCRDGSRTPMPWTSGMADDKLYLPIPASHRARAVDMQEAQPGSMLQFTRDLIKERKENPALCRGVTTVLDTDEKDPDIFAFVRKAEGQTVLLAYNMSSHAKTFHPADYLDEQTLKELHIPAWSDIRVHAYSYSRHGVHAPVQGKGDLVNPDEKVEPELAGKHRAPRVFAADLMVADHIISELDSAPLIRDHQIQPDRKIMIDRQLHQKFLDQTPIPQLTFGGTTGITMWTLKKLLGSDVDINFMGLAGDDFQGRKVKDTLKKAGINLLTETWPEGITPETAMTHVVHFPSGHNSLLTYPGTEAVALNQLLAENPELLKKSIKDSDIVYLPGSFAEKFGQTLTEELLKLRWRYKKELVISLPTSATFGPHDSQTYKNLIASANVVVGNDVEFCRLYDINTPRPISDDDMKKVTENIQNAFHQKVLDNEDRPCPMEQVALITRGDKPALLVTSDKVLEIPVVAKEKVNNLLGVSDTTCAGFLAGYIRGLEHEQSAEMAMGLAAKKIEQQSCEPHLLDPEHALNRAFLRQSLKHAAAAFAANGNGNGNGHVGKTSSSIRA